MTLNENNVLEYNTKDHRLAIYLYDTYCSELQVESQVHEVWTTLIPQPKVWAKSHAKRKMSDEHGIEVPEFWSWSGGGPWKIVDAEKWFITKMSHVLPAEFKA